MIRPKLMSPPAAGRAGFTLVELLVAAALTVLVMAILATAFQTGMQTLSHLKSVVGLSQQLRTAEAVIRRDLGAQHLEGATDSAVRVSTVNPADKTFYKNQDTTQPWVGPARGYLKVVQNSVPVYEGLEDGVPSGRTTDHTLAFTVKLGGTSATDVFTAATADTMLLGVSKTDLVQNPAGQFAGVWAEAGYFLMPTGQKTTPDPTASPMQTALPLFTLFRQQKLLAPTALDVTAASVAAFQAANPDFNVSASATLGKVRVNGPETVAQNPTAFGTPLTDGSDILLSNVISMQVLTQTSTSSNLFAPNTAAVTTDTGSYTAASPVLRAVQVKIRVYDTKNHTTRQVTFAQDL